MKISMWRCPSCQQALQYQNKQWRCEQGHCFDEAKEGYVNLLLAQHKNSKSPGDNKQMVQARRDFLAQGHYQDLALALSSLIIQYASGSSNNEPSTNDALSVFDAGCGEGYYLSHICEELAKQGQRCSASGIDISKIAIQKAAKKYPEMQFAVASTFKLPLEDASQNLVVQIFAPSDPFEVSRILHADGLYLLVNPLPEHLLALKHYVYQDAQTHTEKENIPEGFVSIARQSLSIDITLDTPEQRENLLMMTPYYWSIKPENKAAMLQNLSQVCAYFDIQVLKKH